ncbi:MAG: PDZ domain-containing protein [Deltaproteobacteria bacterium]|nr:PDZ domain-containing protein [Deltaproteobacteria bacterium]
MVTLWALQGCAAVFPRYTTAAREVPAGIAESGSMASAPDELHRLGVVRAVTPLTTRDGRPWDSDGPPDFFVIIRRNGDEVFRSRVIRDSVQPSWDPMQDAVDLFVRSTDVLSLELRDDDGALSPGDLVGSFEIRGGVPAEARNGGVWSVRLEGGAQLELTSHTPRARIGMGVTYEYRTDYLVVIAVAEAGPAYTAGLRVGDRIERINARPMNQLSEADVRQEMDRGTMRDVSLGVTRAGSQPQEFTVRPDALYEGR